MLLLSTLLLGSACVPTSESQELVVLVRGDATIMAKLSSVLVQTLDEDGGELLAYHTFSLVPGAGNGPPLSHAFARPRESGARVRVLALGRGRVNGVERPLVEMQKLLTLQGDAPRQVELYFSDDCLEQFCRTELRGSSLTCVRGSCAAIPDGEDAVVPPRTSDASEPITAAPLDASTAQDAASDAARSVIVSMDSSTIPQTSVIEADAGCTPGAAGCTCVDGTEPPCEVMPPDAGPTCDVGKHVGMFTGAVGPNMSAPNTSVTGTVSFEVPPPGAQITNGSVAITGTLEGKTPTGNTLIARIDGRWNCGKRALEQGRLVDGLFSYNERFLEDITFVGTIAGAYAPSSTTVEGQWTVDSGNNAGGFGTWSARR
jgi:hypothetical protein